MVSTADTITPESVTFLDDVPESGNPRPTSSDLRCLTCNIPLTYGGRGRKPKYCDDHKQTTHNAGGGGGRTPNKALVDRAVSQLELAYQLSGSGLVFIAPVSGQVIARESTKLAESWRPMLESNKKLRDFFIKVEKTAAWLPLIMAHGDVALAIVAEVQQRQQPQESRRGAHSDPQPDVQGFVGEVYDTHPVYG